LRPGGIEENLVARGIPSLSDERGRLRGGGGLRAEVLIDLKSGVPGTGGQDIDGGEGVLAGDDGG
jgi:hypothetical protein